MGISSIEAMVLIQELSAWIDYHNTENEMRLQRWQRVGKIGEEYGEAIEVLIGLDNQNPRKISTYTETDLKKELLDVALTALCAHEHLCGNSGATETLFAAHVQRVHKRAEL